MTGLPILCGHVLNNRGCTNLAVVILDSSIRHALACPQHRSTVERWVATGGPVKVTPVQQPADAIPGDGQAALFDLETR